MARKNFLLSQVKCCPTSAGQWKSDNCNKWQMTVKEWQLQQMTNDSERVTDNKVVKWDWPGWGTCNECGSWFHKLHHETERSDQWPCCLACASPLQALLEELPSCQQQLLSSLAGRYVLKVSYDATVKIRWSTEKKSWVTSVWKSSSVLPHIRYPSHFHLFSWTTTTTAMQNCRRHTFSSLTWFLHWDDFDSSTAQLGWSVKALALEMSDTCSTMRHIIGV